MSPPALWKSHTCLWGSHLNTTPALNPSQLAQQGQHERLEGVLTQSRGSAEGDGQREGPGWQQVLDAVEE